jgi:hypothetical protein
MTDTRPLAPLVQTEDGNWIDLSTIAAVSCNDKPIVFVDRHPPLWTVSIQCKDMDSAIAERDRLAAARNAAAVVNDEASQREYPA